MIQIIKGEPFHAKELLALSTTTFLDAHGHSASKADIDAYVKNNFNEDFILNELSNPDYQYFLMFDNDELIGYTKFILNAGHDLIPSKSVCKLERIYILKNYYGSGFSNQLLNFVIQYSKDYMQNGLWLNVWIENKRAIGFYHKLGFKIIGEYQFQISKNHSNPNHVMYLEF
jgi:ribosomal protein S18 acetylase RimI-like enzyme